MNLEAFAESIAITVCDGENFTASLSLPGELAVFEGHFPGNPILPGVAYIFIAEKLAGRFVGEDLMLKELKKTKFFAPTLPRTHLEAAGSVKKDVANEKLLHLQITFSDDEKRRISIVKMIMEKR